MYQIQLINLLREFCLISSHNFNFNRLLNDIDYRNQQLLLAQLENNRKINRLVKQIHAIEDLMSYTFEVDLLSKTNSKKITQQSKVGMAVLAFTSLMFVAVAVTVVEDVKQQRVENSLLHVAAE